MRRAAFIFRSTVSPSSGMRGNSAASMVAVFGITRD
jgi:hypothetical protein